MGSSIKRYFLIFIGVAGMLASGAFMIMCIRDGSVPSPIYAASIAGDTYHKAENPSQFWFVLALNGAAFGGFAWIAWRAYRS